MADAVARFAETHPGGDRLAVTSLWTAHVFAGLIAPSLAAGAQLDTALLPEAVSLAPETGLPTLIHVTEELALPARLPAQVDRLLADCIAPVIRLLRRETGLSARLLWENAGGHLFWTLEKIACQHSDRAGDVGEALTALRWPREACSTLTLMRADALAGETPLRRRVCCLRHALPGFSECEGICPLLRQARKNG